MNIGSLIFNVTFNHGYLWVSFVFNFQPDEELLAQSQTKLYSLAILGETLH